MLYLYRISHSILNVRKIFLTKFFLHLSIAAAAGLLAGGGCGSYIVNNTLKGEISFLTFIFSPSENLIHIYSLLNDGNDYKRLAGYYAYKDSGYADPDFLFERYKLEDSDIIKKVIIWTAESTITGEKRMDFYAKIYNVSPDSIKKQLHVKMKK